MTEQIAWTTVTFDQLSGSEVYEILALRQSVFLLEQAIPVLDADGLDVQALHLAGRRGGRVCAYARLFLPSESDAQARIGRVAVSDHARGAGLGRGLMVEALRELSDRAAGADVKISAQAHLVEFYRSLGFATVSDTYDDHGVPHIDMVRPAR